MRKFLKFLTLGFVLVVSSCSHQPAYAWSLKDMNKTVNQTNFMINGNCSGTRIPYGKNNILTAYHCISSPHITDDAAIKQITADVSQYDHRDYLRIQTVTYKAKVSSYSKEYDIAILTTIADLPEIDSPTKFLPDDKDFQRGEDVWVVGNPAGIYGSVLKGTISNKTQRFNDAVPVESGGVELFQFSGGITGGNSGGSIFTKKGYFIGMPIIVRRGSPFMANAVPVQRIKKFLTDNKLEIQ